MKLTEWIVDAMPGRLWRPGNLRQVRGRHLHFCFGEHPRLRVTVRTIEWGERDVFRGRRHVELPMH